MKLETASSRTTPTAALRGDRTDGRGTSAKPGPDTALLLGLGAAASLLILMFLNRFQELYGVWMEDENYSHGFLVPLVSGYLAWIWCSEHDHLRAPAPALGIACLLGGCLLHLAAVVVWLPPVDYFALVALLYGLALVVGGAVWARGLIFPTLFLFFMFPLPVGFTERVAVRLQLIVATAATWVLQLFLPTYQEGNFIYLPGQQLEVGEACSGLRQVVAFAALTMLVAHLANRPRIFKIALVLSGFPVAIAANLLRVLLMAFIMWNFGAEWIQGKLHSFWGLVTMVAGLGLLVGVNWWLGKILCVANPPDQSAAEKSSAATPVQPVRLANVLVCLGLTAGLQWCLVQHLEAGELDQAPGLQKSLSGFPVSLGAWLGQDKAPTTLPYYKEAEDRLCREFQLQSGPNAGTACALWMVHFMDGRDRQHHPLICYKVGGFAEELGARGSVALPGQPAPVERFGFTRDGVTSYVYYWHYTLEPPLRAETSLLQLIHQRRGQLLPSLTVEVFATPKHAGQLDALAEFVQLVDEQLRQHLPPTARMGSNILPVRYTGGPRLGAPR